MNKKQQEQVKNGLYIAAAIAAILFIVWAIQKVAAVFRKIPPAQMAGDGVTITNQQARAHAEELNDTLLCNVVWYGLDYNQCFYNRCDSLSRLNSYTKDDDFILVYNQYNGISDNGLRQDISNLYYSCQPDHASLLINRMNKLGLQ